MPGTPGKGIWSKKRNVDGKLQVQVEKGGDGSTRKSWMGDKKWPVEYDHWEQQGMSQESIYKNRTVCLSDRLRVRMLNGRNANHVTLPAICEARLWLVIINRWSACFSIHRLQAQVGVNCGCVGRVMLYIATLVEGVDEASRIIRRTLMRYLTLGSLIVFQATSVRVKKRFPTMDHILEAGVMT